MNYVISDIHGRRDMFLDVMQKAGISGNDKLYVLGDAIDRGPSPIQLLTDIMGRKNTVFLIGNHEHMMLRALLYEDERAMRDWMYNGGAVTLRQFTKLPRFRQERILKWLLACPLYIPSLTVEGRKFYLAHASHAKYPEKNVLKYSDAGAENIRQAVWSREYKDPDRRCLAYEYASLYAQYPGTSLSIGHTPVHHCSSGKRDRHGFNRISTTAKRHLINVDCGAAAGLTLGCLRLEDMAEFYADQKSAAQFEKERQARRRQLYPAKAERRVIH